MESGFSGCCFSFEARLGRIKGDPCSVEAVSDSLIGELSAEEPISSIRIGSCFKSFTYLGALEVLCEAIRKDLLVGFAVGFVVKCCLLYTSDAADE